MHWPPCKLSTTSPIGVFHLTDPDFTLHALSESAQIKMIQVDMIFLHCLRIAFSFYNLSEFRQKLPAQISNLNFSADSLPNTRTYRQTGR